MNYQESKELFVARRYVRRLEAAVLAYHKVFEGREITGGSRELLTQMCNKLRDARKELEELKQQEDKTIAADNYYN